jgi:hypothetical protein
VSSPRRTIRRDWPVIAGLVASIALFALSACSATRVTDVWTDPGYSGGPLHQVAVFVLGTDEAIRDLVENEFARRLPMSTRGIGGHGFVPAAEQGDIEKVRARIQAAGFDGVIIGRVVGVEGPQRWAPGSLQQLPQSYRTLDNYYVATYQETERSPFQANTVVRVQTNVYAVASQALIWSAASQTFNPEEARDAAGDLAKAVVAQLQKAGILAAE